MNGTAQIILQPIFDLESPRVAIGRVALIGDAAFVARPHVASGVMKAALDAEALADALSAGAGDVEAALQRYDAGRQPYGAWLVQRGRHIGATIAARNMKPSQRVETHHARIRRGRPGARPADRRAGRRMSPRPK